MTKEPKIAQEIHAISGLIHKGEYQKALERFRDLEAEYSENRAIELNKVGFLIDIGLGLRSSEFVEQGVANGERLLRDPSLKNREHLCYNIANGYTSLFRLQYDKSKGIEQLVDNENLQKAKRLFREAVAAVDQLDLGLRKQVWTNYGNCLDQLGRVMEALYAYDEALLIDPRFPMALGNKAVAVLFFADVSGAHREAMYIKAYQMLKSVLENKDLVRFGGIAAKDSFENVSKGIEELFRDKSVLSISLEHPRYDVAHMTAFERFYTDFCSTYRLFLNFHIHEDECEASVVDPVFISLITPINDNETYYDLAKHINQIKEDYGVARLLLAQSQFRREDLDRISKRTTFVNALDYSVFNIYVGLLKSAFKEAYNILDKIAVFINEYFRIGLKQENVQFYSKIDRRCIWREKGEVREKILLSRNISLYALYDIYLDFDSGYYKKLQDIRNALVHRRLVVYDSLLADRGKTDDIQNIGYETMLSEAIRLLQLVKSSIIYLINFVQLEEEKKRDPTDLIPPMYVDTTQFL